MIFSFGRIDLFIQGLTSSIRRRFSSRRVVQERETGSKNLLCHWIDFARLVFIFSFANSLPKRWRLTGSSMVFFWLVDLRSPRQ
jgi:hypothetical protein